MNQTPAKPQFSLETLEKLETTVSSIFGQLRASGLITQTELRLMTLASHVIFHAWMRSLKAHIGEFTPQEESLIVELFDSHFGVKKG